MECFCCRILTHYHKLILGGVGDKPIFYWETWTKSRKLFFCEINIKSNYKLVPDDDHERTGTKSNSDFTLLLQILCWHNALGEPRRSPWLWTSASWWWLYWSHWIHHGIFGEQYICFIEAKCVLVTVRVYSFYKILV